MEKVEVLEKFFSAFAYSDNPKEFFYGLRHYIDFVRGENTFNDVLEGLLAEGKEESEKFEKVKSIAIQKLSQIHDELYDYVCKNNIQDDVKEAFNDYNSWLNQRSPEWMQGELEDVVHWLEKRPEHEKFASQYIEFSQPNKARKISWACPNEYEEFWRKSQEYNAKIKNELWGQMENLLRHIDVIKSGREKHNELTKQTEKTEGKYLDILNQNFLLSDWKRVENGDYDGLKVFLVENFRPSITNFHNHILKKTSEKSKPSAYSQIKIRLSFFPETGDAEYKTAVWNFKGKACAFLKVLHKNKNMAFRISEIKEFCNPLITVKKYEFKGAKDINDTLREIRANLKVKKGELFPIFKNEKGWIWLEK